MRRNHFNSADHVKKFFSLPMSENLCNENRKVRIKCIAEIQIAPGEGRFEPVRKDPQYQNLNHYAKENFIFQLREYPCNIAHD